MTAANGSSPTVSAKAPRELVQDWVEAFNRADVESLASLYAEQATNHQVAQAPVVGRAAIREMFEREFARAKMVCIVENLFQDGDWAILEWRDRRGYWDKLSFLRLYGLDEGR